MQLQIQILPAETIPLGQGGGGVAPIPPGPTFYILQENGDNFLTEDGDLYRQE